MSIAIGLIGTDGIVLATDSKATEKRGESRHSHETAKKLWLLDSYSYGLSSVSNDAQFSEFLIEQINNWLSDKKLQLLDFNERIVAISKALADTYKTYTQSVLYPDMSSSQSSMKFMIAGYTNSGKPKLVAFDSSFSDASFVPRYYAYHPQGKPTIPLHLLEIFSPYLYKKIEGKYTPFKKTKVKMLMKIAVMVIDECSITDDLDIGGLIQMAIVKPTGIEKIDSQKLEILRGKIRERVTNKDIAFNNLAEIDFEW